jgi:dTDP-4-amino-4,6-dideoxygalactose transaminase
LYADINPSTFNLTLETIMAAIGAQPQADVKAILIQHSFGIPAETHPIVSWARSRGIFTIEDCAHVWGSRYCDTSGLWLPVGTLADASFFSSQWTKPVSTGLGGWVETQNRELHDALQEFRNSECVSPGLGEVLLLAAQIGVRNIVAHPRFFWAVKTMYQALYKRGLLVGTSSEAELRGEMPIGYAKRMSSFQEWLLHRLRSGDSLLTHRRRLAKIYDGALQSVGLPVLQVQETVDPILLRYPVRVGHKARALAEAKKRGIELGDWYSHPIDHPESLEAVALGYQPGNCPEGERAGLEVVNLPMDRNLTEDSAKDIVKFLREVA